MTEWKKYLGDRLMRFHESNFYIIRPSSDLPANSVPVFCKVCDDLMMSDYDVMTHEKFGCCDACANEWAYPRNSEWISGWRPTVEDVQKSVSSRRRR